MFAGSVLCIYDNQPTDQPRPRNNTNRSYYHRQTTNRYPTENERNKNQSDCESKNQQQEQKQEPKTTTTNKTQQQHHAEIWELQPQQTMNTQQQQENVTIRKPKTTSTGNTNSTRNTNSRDNTILIPFSINGYKKWLPNPEFYT